MILTKFRNAVCRMQPLVEQTLDIKLGCVDVLPSDEAKGHILAIVDSLPWAYPYRITIAKEIEEGFRAIAGYSEIFADEKEIASCGEDFLDYLATHELTHLGHFRLLPGTMAEQYVEVMRLPTWLKEGFAEYVAIDVLGKDRGTMGTPNEGPADFRRAYFKDKFQRAKHGDLVRFVKDPDEVMRRRMLEDPRRKQAMAYVSALLRGDPLK